MHRVASSPNFQRRIPCLLRPLRPPNPPPNVHAPRAPSRTLSYPRLFTHNSQLLLVAGRLVSRPQLPFLHQSTASGSNKITHPSSRGLVQRFLSTERKQRWKDRFWWQVRFHAYFWPVALLVVVIIAGLDQTKFEHDYPTPREWTFWSRWVLRSAMYQEFEEERVRRGFVDWSRVGGLYAKVLERLESEKWDGKRLMRQGDGGILVDGLGETGLDVSMKSEEWRRGYWQTLMGCGRASERLEGMVKKKGIRKRQRPVEKECVVGAGNERPRPMPWGVGEAWHVDEVEDAFPSPETFYLRVLTTNGFTSGQKLEAALAYADWCDFKGMSGTAEGMLDWGMDLAVAGLESTGKSGDLVDKKTGVIDSKRAGDVSANLLKVCTAFGVHFAQQGEIKKALPIFLSVLKARKELPAEPLYAQRAGQDDTKKKSGKDVGLWPYLYAMRDWLVEAPYPARPPSGDETPYHSLKEACEEVGLMTYIGEILYATSSREKGLSWTRDAVDAAEAVMWVMQEEEREDGKERCRECLKTGLENWKTMARSLIRDSEAKEKQLFEKSANKKWYDPSSVDKQSEHARLETKKWKEEDVQIELRRAKTMPLIMPLKPVDTGWLSV